MATTITSIAMTPTKAALELEQQAESISPHKLIELMFEGAIERIEQAKSTLSAGQEEQTGQLIGKVVNIVDGLKGSLDHDGGGDIASGLDTLYSYINERLNAAEMDTGNDILNEAEQLLKEVKSGWNAIAPMEVA